MTVNANGDDVTVLESSGGVFDAIVPSFGAGASTIAVTAVDVDRDGDLDLVTADFNGNDVTVLRSLAARGTSTNVMRRMR